MAGLVMCALISVPCADMGKFAIKLWKYDQGKFNGVPESRRTILNLWFVVLPIVE